MSATILKTVNSMNGSQTKTDGRMPVLFVGHGSPMNAIDKNSYTEHLSKLGETLPRPKAIVTISAHWVTRGTKVLKAEKPETIHDFYGFPAELFAMQYPAKGSPETSARVRELLMKHHAEETGEWGLDHGTWAVLHHMYPNADVPVLQLSLNANLSAREHYELAKDLGALRDQGILILGSGNVTHNLRAVDYSPNAKPVDWAIEFDQLIKTSLLDNNLEQLFAEDPARHSLWKQAHPTAEHYLPLIYVAGAGSKDGPPSFPHEEIQAGSLSMRSVQYGA